MAQPKTAPARWPQMMKRATAAAYCDLSASAFEGEVAAGRLPTPVTLGRRDHWHRPALDNAMTYLAGGDPGQPWDREFWEDGKPVPSYRRELRQRYADRGE